MSAITKGRCLSVRSIALFLSAIFAGRFLAAGVIILSSGLTNTTSGNHFDFVFSDDQSEPLHRANSPDLRHWTNFQSATQGDGTLSPSRLPMRFRAARVFFDFWSRSQRTWYAAESTAFDILGYYCGGIKEQSMSAGFDPTNGYLAGMVNLSTTCSGSGRGGSTRPRTRLRLS